MKLFSATIYEDRLNWWTGKDVSKVRHTGPCDPLELPDNAEEVVYKDKTNQKKRVQTIAHAVCKPGYFPNISKGRKLRAKCMKRKTGYEWNRTLPECVTCEHPDPTDMITSGDDGISVYCDYTKKARHKCKLTCLNDMERISHPESKRRPKKKSMMYCKCRRGSCSWMNNRVKDITLDEFVCKANGPTPAPIIPIDCADKKPTCTDVSAKVDKLNSWTCRNCFRIRSYFKFSQFGLTDFDNKDYMDIEFSDQVFHVKHAHPAESFEDMGNNIWRVRFSKFAMFGNREMDFTAEFRSVNPRTPEIVAVKTCPCQNE